MCSTALHRMRNYFMGLVASVHCCPWMVQHFNFKTNEQKGPDDTLQGDSVQEAADRSAELNILLACLCGLPR